MTWVMRKPILVAGLGLSVVFLGWESLHDHLSGIGEWGLWIVIAFGLVMGWLRPKSDQAKGFKPFAPITQAKLDETIHKAQKSLDILGQEAPDFDLTPLQTQLNTLPQRLNDSHVTIAITGGKATGKTTLKHHLDGHSLGENVQILDTDALFTETNGVNIENLQIADLVLFLTNGDLTDTEWQTLQSLHRHYQHPILLFNKQDRHLPEDRTLIVQMLRKRVESILSGTEVVPVSLNPNPVTVRRYDSEGNMAETLEPQPPELNGLIAQLNTILSEDRSSLVLGRLWREATQIQHQAKTQLNRVRREKAIPIIENYQWVAGTIAVANPMASLDLVATAAITGQMVMDLGGIYSQSFSLSQSQTVSAEMAKLMVKLGLVELSTQAIGSLLKSHAITYLAGGLIQGVSAAYLTRIAGLSLIEYFQDQELNTDAGNALNLERLTDTLKQVFNNNQRLEFLKGFVSQALAKVAVSKPIEAS